MRTMTKAAFGAAALAALAATTALTAPGALTARAQDAAAAEVPLIPRKDIFGNPARTAPQISPDGSQIAFLAPKDGVMNVFVGPAGDIEAAKPVTDEKTRPIRQFMWALNGEQILYFNDDGGNENFLLFAADVKTGENKKLTPFEKTRVFMLNRSWDTPDVVAIGLNNRDASWHDVYTLNTRTGELTLVKENTEQWAGFTVDDDYKVRFGEKTTPDGGSVISKIGEDGSATEFAKIGLDDSQTTGLAGLTSDGKTLYMIDSRERNTAGLFGIDIATGEATLIGENPKADISGAVSDPVTGVVQAFSTNYIKDEIVAVDPAMQADIDFLNAQLPGQWGVSSQTKDNRKWIVVHDATVEPVEWVLYDRDAKTVTKLFSARPNLDDKTLAPMEGVEIKSRDGKTLVSYLTIPAGSDADGNGRPDKPVPMVLNVHGGPWARDTYGYDGEAQWLANRGYAVLQVNFRGSTGFGKDFINASNREWGGKMHEDLLDAVDWAIAEGVTTADKVAIYGGSYGGYATMVGMTMTPERFACGVNIVGVTNLNTFMNTIPPYWDAFRPQLYARVGDPTTEEGKAFLASRSPVNFADKITKPLLVAQGANDPRVNKDESDQIVAAAKKNGAEVTYVLYPDEGHGFARPMNRTSFYAISEAFLSECLGGRFEPVGEDFNGSTLQVLEGVDAVPGLKEALDAMPKPN